MKTAILLAAGAATAAYAKPHGHAHKHHRREPDAVTVVQPVSTAFAYVLNGETISQDDVCEGIKSGALKWDGTPPAGACDAVTSVAVPSPTPTPTQEATTSSVEPTTSAAAAQFYQESSSSAEAPAATSPAAPSPSSSPASSSQNKIGNVGLFTSALAQNDYPDFPDGELSCSGGVPQEYGAIPVNYLGNDGWTGFQILNGAQNNILGDGSSCQDGYACNFACAPGFQGMQWVTDQPANGASIGGLLCKGGKLYKANDNPKLCGKGTGGVTIKNEAGSNFAVCRTAYPGKEDEVIPVDVASGDTQPLTCPDQNTYYQHQGQATSAQYYLNPLGVASDEACSWNGKGDKQTGNWAPINLGVGSVAGVKWLSIFQNAPTTSAVYQGTVNITGDGISASCSYEPTADGKDGKYCGATGCQYVSSGSNAGCTVSVTGDAVFIVSN